MFTAQSGALARSIAGRASVDGHEELSVVAKSTGRMSLEDVKRVMESELQKVPKGLEV